MTKKVLKFVLIRSIVRNVHSLFIFGGRGMAIERNTFLEVLKDAYSAYYSIIPEEPGGELPLSFRAVYGARDEQYETRLR